MHCFPCRELRDLSTLPNGDVVRCGMDHKPVGNVREQSFDEIWFGTAIEAFRKKDDCPASAVERQTAFASIPAPPHGPGCIGFSFRSQS